MVGLENGEWRREDSRKSQDNQGSLVVVSRLIKSGSKLAQGRRGGRGGSCVGFPT